MKISHRANTETPLSSATKISYWVLFLYLLIVVSCVLRVCEVWTHNPIDHIFSDTQRHWDQAKEPLTPSPMAIFDPPAYQMWLSLVQKWSLGVPQLIAFYASMLSLVTPWLWYRFLRELLSSRTLALVGWAVLALLPSWLAIYSYFMTETLLLPLLGASLWQTLRARRKPTVGNFVGMAALWLAAGMVRPIVFPLGGLAGALVWWKHPYKIRSAAWSLLLVVLVMGPFAYRNYQFTKLWAPYGNGKMIKILAESDKAEILLHLHRDGAEWVYGFASPTQDTFPLRPLSNWQSLRKGTVEVSIDMTKGAEDWDSENKRTAAHGMRELQLRWENFLLVMASESWPDNNQAYLSNQLSIASRWLWMPLLLAVIGWTAWTWREAARAPLLPILIVTWLVFQAFSLVSFNEGRYRKPFEGLLVVQTLALCDQALRRRRQRRLLDASQNTTESPSSN